MNTGNRPDKLELADSQGLQVNVLDAKTMLVAVEPGRARLKDGRVLELAERQTLRIRPAGKRSFRDHRYSMQGEGETSPCGWNGEGPRGSGGAPYQRMAPGELRVFKADRSLEYELDRDYVCDYYWGTIKRKPEGRIAAGEQLSLDYAVWLCRYDTVVLDSYGRIRLIEGDPEPTESRELLLPDPPSPGSGLPLANLFVAWGSEALYDGAVNIIAAGLTHREQPAVSGRYQDMAPRTYMVECSLVPAESGRRGMIRMGATGEEYGTGHVHTPETMRWTELMEYDLNQPVPLLLQSAHGTRIDWGLRLDLSQISLSASEPVRIEVEAEPIQVFDLRSAPADPSSLIPVEQPEGLDRLKEKLSNGEAVRIAFFGESTTRSGRWPYLMVNRLKEMYPAASIRMTNAAVGGESSVRGEGRLESEVLKVDPDFVFIEYMINDAGSGKPELIRETMERIIRRIRAYGADCAVVTLNGMNPQFRPLGAASNYRMYDNLLRDLAREHGVAFIDGYAYFDRLHETGRYFLTELKGNMVNHSWGNVDRNWGSFDNVAAEALSRAMRPEEQ